MSSLLNGPRSARLLGSAATIAVALSIAVSASVPAASATRAPSLTPEQPHVVASAAKKPSTFVAAWRDAKGLSTKLRQGVYNTRTKKGFGWAKIKGKHGIKKYQTVKHPTGNPKGPKFKGSKRQYVAYATRWVNRRVVEQIPVYTVVETAYFKTYYGVALRAAPEILTTYCANKNKSNRCPKWVDTAFSKKNNGSAKYIPLGLAPIHGGTDYSWSFEPVR